MQHRQGTRAHGVVAASQCARWRARLDRLGRPEPKPLRLVAMTAAEPIAEFRHDRVTVIEPRSGWRLLDLHEVWAYRELFWVLTRRDLKVRYRQAVLGAAWALLRPALTMLIFTVVFGRLVGVPSEGYPYAVFVFAGLLPWTFFAGAVTT